MEDICIIAYLMILSNLQLIAGQLPDTESLRNVTHCDISSALRISCGTDEVIALHSIKLAYNVKCETTCCNTYNSLDCFAGFDADVTREFRRTCSGRQTCTVPSIQNTADFCSFGVRAVSYVFLQYYCIPENRKVAICDIDKALTSDGPPLYITSATYPDVTIGSTSCACSIEANSCSSSITLYEADIDLYLDTSNCLQNVVFKNGTDGVLAKIGCESYYTEYITTRTINSHYSKIDFINNSTASQEGLFFLGLKASEDGVSFSISCSSVPEHWCVGCGPFQNITNGILEVRDNDDTSYGAIADVRCNKGYETNTSAIGCQANNTWQDVVCTANDCGPAPTVDFGNITLNGTTTFGSTATVECETGYQSNKTTVTCLASGQWETPECIIKGKLTLEDAVDVKCSVSNWKVSINMVVLRSLYPTVSQGAIYMGQPQCQGQLEYSTLTFQYSLEACKTKEITSGVTKFYSNKLFYAVFDPIHPFVIRRHIWTFAIECDVIKAGTGTSHLHHGIENHHSTFVIRYNVTVELFKDQNFQYPLSESRQTVHVGDDVYVKVSTSIPDWNTKMRLHTCFTNSNRNASADMEVLLINNGCEVDANTHIISQSTHETRFVFQDFEYVTNDEGLDIYCNATFCDAKDYSLGCVQSCFQNPTLIG